MTDKSLTGLLEFLDWTAEKGLMAKNTVGGRKAAASNVLGVLDPEEKGDVTAVDLDHAMTRFVNLHGRKYTTNSLNVYKSRTHAAISDFQKWLNDPLTFKPYSNKGDKKPVKPSQKAEKGSLPKGATGDNQGQSLPSISQPASANVFPIPIRETVVVRIHGLPFDLTPAEAKKIAAVIQAMAMLD